MGKTPIVLLWLVSLFICWYTLGICGDDICLFIAVVIITFAVSAIGNYFYFYQKRWTIEDQLK